MPIVRLCLSESRALRYAVFFYLYVMQGIPAGFAMTALANFLAAEGLEPKVIGTFAAAVGLPWAFQFVWGPVVDRFQGSPMGRRRPWVVLSQFLAFVASLGLLLVDDPASQVGLLSLAFFIHSVFASLQDASVDAMAISFIPESERGRVNAFMRGGFLIGIGAGAAVLSQVLHRSGFFYAALLQSLVLLAMTVLTVFVRERPGDALMPWGSYQADSPVRPRARDLNLRQIITELVRGLGSSESLRLFGAIALVYVSASVFLRVFSIHLIQQLGWPDASLSLFSGTYGTLGALLVVIVGGTLSDRFGNRRLLGFVMLFIGGFLLTFNLLAPYWSTAAVATTGLMIWYTFDPVLSVAAMPVLMAICRKDVEGSQFTAYMALVNLSDVAGAYLSGQALTWVSAPVIGFGCGVVVLASTAALVLTFLDSPRSRGRLEPAG